MGNFIFNCAKGKIRTYAESVGTGGAELVAILAKVTGLELDQTLRGYNNIASLFAGGNDEADFTNYARKHITTGITVNQDNTNNRVDIDIPDIVWTSAGGVTNNTVACLIIAFDPNNASGDDTSLVPVAKYDAPFTTDGTDQTIVINGSGLFSIVES